jgi:hypothetical protein
VKGVRGRAYTRHHEERWKKRVERYFVFTATARQRGMMARTPKLCSRYCCGNPRRHFGERTVQERRWLAARSEWT